MINEEEEISQELNRVEGLILERIAEIKNVINDNNKWIAEEIAMKEQSSHELIYPKYDERICYPEELLKVSLINEIMRSKIKEYSVLNKLLTTQIHELEETEKEWSEICLRKNNNRRRSRRPLSEMIEKSFKCPFPNCNKAYGSDVSLNLHIKFKHKSSLKTERETDVCLAELENLKIDTNITFPRREFEKLGESFTKEKTYE